ncbi:hypothetical protein KA005_78975 [bacterium]|nr:hypothetical protein [bacterium]
MPEWLISLISVIVGAAIGIGGTELVQFLKRPRLEIDFEEKEKQKPYIPDFNDESVSASGITFRVRYLRLRIRNIGKKPATDCEPKLEIFIENEVEPASKTTLHWSRRDPALYSNYGEGGALLSVEPEKVYAPISLNINDEETVDVFRLQYSFSTTPNTDLTPRGYPHIESISLRQLVIQSNSSYHCKVTVYASNAIPKSFSFITCWDGTLKGFNKAFAEKRAI